MINLADNEVKFFFLIEGKLLILWLRIIVTIIGLLSSVHQGNDDLLIMAVVM
jgi:hypothetical protein